MFDELLAGASVEIPTAEDPGSSPDDWPVPDDFFLPPRDCTSSFHGGTDDAPEADEEPGYKIVQMYSRQFWKIWTQNFTVGLIIRLVCVDELNLSQRRELFTWFGVSWTTASFFDFFFSASSIFHCGTCGACAAAFAACVAFVWRRSSTSLIHGGTSVVADLIAAAVGFRYIIDAVSRLGILTSS